MAAFLCSTSTAGLTALIALLVRPFLDGIIVDKNRTLLMLLPIVLLSVTVIKGLMSYAQAYLMTYVSNWLVADLRELLFVNLVRLPIRFHDSNASGRLSSRIVGDVASMGNALPWLFKNMIQQLLTALGMLGVLLYQDWKMTAVLVVTGPVVVYLAISGGRLRQLARRGQELAGDMAVFLKDTFTGIRILKIYGREEHETIRFRVSSHAFARNAIKSGQASAWNSPIAEMLGVTVVTVIMVYVGYQVIEGAMTPGAATSFVAALAMASTPIRRMAGVQQYVQSTLAAAERVFAVVDLEREGAGDEGKAVLPRLSRAIEFHQVNFRYPGAQEDTVKRVSFTIRAGQVVALVGKTGSGKTTLANLLPRFYDPVSGSILIDGRDIKAVSLSSLRAQMAIVSQDTVLFDDTVRNNIAYSRIDAREEEIVDAARAAYAMEFIERFPAGMDTLIGENGLKLSGGQRQRLAIARAILRNAPLLILDEATSSLDVESERLVQHGLANLMKGRTTLVIAHRLSTIRQADHIVVLQQGVVIGQGCHHTLLETCDVYRRLCEDQSQIAPQNTAPSF
jgi:subfamily B ATP-binding cassette protein MsbA